MPASISDAGKPLANPIPPVDSPPPSSQAERPPWSRRLSSRRTISSPSSRAVPVRPFSQRAFHTAERMGRKILSSFQKLSLLYKVLVVIGGLAFMCLAIVLLIYNERIYAALVPLAKKWRAMTGGWLIVWGLTFICSFPPLIGYSTAVAISGFVYGFPNGWYIVATATVIGSLSAFLASRTVLSSYVHRLVGEDKRFEALALTLKHDGLKVLCMIRLCPLPFSLSNAALSTFPTIHPLSFALATLISTPKLLVHVFIGSRLAIIAEQGGKMDTSTRIVNYASIFFGGVLGASVGYFIYQRTVVRAQQLEEQELEAARDEGGESAGSYFDGSTDVGATMNDEDISLWDNEDEVETAAAFRDASSYTEDDVFAGGDALGNTHGSILKR